jgi:hypothetical protein
MPTVGNKTNETVTHGNVEVEESSTEVVKQNLGRYGLELINESSHAMNLGLGKAAEAKKGIFLAASGGSWNGQVGTMQWTGSVFAIAQGAAKQILTVIEV